MQRNKFLIFAEWFDKYLDKIAQERWWYERRLLSLQNLNEMKENNEQIFANIK